jgi:hypothetical protein
VIGRGPMQGGAHEQAETGDDDAPEVNSG